MNIQKMTVSAEKQRKNQSNPWYKSSTFIGTSLLFVMCVDSVFLLTVVAANIEKDIWNSSHLVF